MSPNLKTLQTKGSKTTTCKYLVTIKNIAQTKILLSDKIITGIRFLYSKQFIYLFIYSAVIMQCLKIRLALKFYFYVYFTNQLIVCALTR